MSANDIFAGCYFGTTTQHVSVDSIQHRITTGDLLFLEQIECIIFSAFKSTASDIDNLAHDYQMEKWLISKNVPYKKIIGMYQGNKELSFLIKLDTATREYEIIEGLVNKCLQYKQDSLLLLETENAHQKRPAWIAPLLKFAPLNPRYAGLLHEVAQEEALKQDSYTYDDKYNKYFIIN